MADTAKDLGGYRRPARRPVRHRRHGGERVLRQGLTPGRQPRLSAGRAGRAGRRPGRRWPATRSRPATARCGCRARAPAGGCGSRRRASRRASIACARTPARAGHDVGVVDLRHVARAAAATNARRLSDPRTSGSPVRQCWPREAAEARGQRQAPRRVARVDVAAPVALPGEREHRVRPEQHVAVDPPGEVHAEERVARVGHRVDRARARDGVRPGHEAVVLAAERARSPASAGRRRPAGDTVGLQARRSTTRSATTQRPLRRAHLDAARRPAADPSPRSRAATSCAARTDVVGHRRGDGDEVDDRRRGGVQRRRPTRAARPPAASPAREPAQPGHPVRRARPRSRAAPRSPRRSSATTSLPHSS